MAHPLDFFKFCPHCGSPDFLPKNSFAKRCEACGFEYYLNEVAAVAVFIVSEKGELLLTTRGHEPMRGSLDLPGGFVDPGESAEQALAREIKEELNLDVDNIQYCFSVPNEYLYSGFTVRTLDLFFRVEIKDMAQIACHDDVAKAAFFPLSEIDIAQIGLQSIKKAVGRFIDEAGN